MTSLNDLMEKFNQEADAITDFLAKGANPMPGDLSFSKNKIRQKIKSELIDEESYPRFDKGLGLILNNLKAHLTPVQFEDLTNELNQALENMVSLGTQWEISTDDLVNKIDSLPNSLQEVLGISEKTIEFFYQEGRRCYQHAHYIDASDIFYTISLLSPGKFNVWLSLGLAEKMASHYDKALQAFAMASILDPISPFPHIQSSECYLMLMDKTHAKETLEYALKMLSENPHANFEREEIRIKNLLSEKFAK